MRTAGICRPVVFGGRESLHLIVRFVKRKLKQGLACFDLLNRHPCLWLWVECTGDC